MILYGINSAGPNCVTFVGGYLSGLITHFWLHRIDYVRVKLKPELAAGGKRRDHLGNAFQGAKGGQYDLSIGPGGVRRRLLAGFFTPTSGSGGFGCFSILIRFAVFVL